MPRTPTSSDLHVVSDFPRPGDIVNALQKIIALGDPAFVAQIAVLVNRHLEMLLELVEQQSQQQPVRCPASR